MMADMTIEDIRDMSQRDVKREFKKHSFITIWTNDIDIKGLYIQKEDDEHHWYHFPHQYSKRVRTYRAALGALLASGEIE